MRSGTLLDRPVFQYGGVREVLEVGLLEPAARPVRGDRKGYPVVVELRRADVVGPHGVEVLLAVQQILAVRVAGADEPTRDQVVEDRGDRAGRIAENGVGQRPGAHGRCGVPGQVDRAVRGLRVGRAGQTIEERLVDTFERGVQPVEHLVAAALRANAHVVAVRSQIVRGEGLIRGSGDRLPVVEPLVRVGAGTVGQDRRQRRATVLANGQRTFGLDVDQRVVAAGTARRTEVPADTVGFPGDLDGVGVLLAVGRVHGTHHVVVHRVVHQLVDIGIAGAGEPAGEQVRRTGREPGNQ